MFKRSVAGNHRQQHPELGAPRLAVELDNPAMVADDLGDQCEPSPVPFRLVVTNGSNRCDRKSSGMPAPLSTTDTTSGKCTRLSLPGTASLMPC